jgi:hypothetical protein
MGRDEGNTREKRGPCTTRRRTAVGVTGRLAALPDGMHRLQVAHVCS